MEVSIPIKADDYQYIKIGVWYDTDIREGETTEKAYSRAWRIAERELGKKRDEYVKQLGS